MVTNLRSADNGTAVQFDLSISAFAPVTASMVAAMITQPLSTGTATAFAGLSRLSKLIPGDYVIRTQPSPSRARREDAVTDGTATFEALQELLDVEKAAHAEEKATLTHLLDTASEEKAMVQAAHVEEKAAHAEEKATLTQLLDTASEEMAMLQAAHAEEKAALTQLLATGKDYPPWFIAIACIQVQSHAQCYGGMFLKNASNISGKSSKFQIDASESTKSEFRRPAVDLKSVIKQA